MTFDKCCGCKHAFITDKKRLYCKKSLADKDDCGEYEESYGCYENGKLSIEDLYNQANDFYRQMLEEKDRTLAEIVANYDFIVGSAELKAKLTEILPKEAKIVYSPFIEDVRMIYAVKKFDVMDLLQESKEEE